MQVLLNVNIFQATLWLIHTMKDDANTNELCKKEENLGFIVLSLHLLCHGAWV